MEDLGKRNDIIITKADKGVAVVILDVENYIKEAHRQLNDEQCYKRLDNDPTKHHAVKVHEAIDKFRIEGLLTDKVASGLKTTNPKTPKFSLLPKIHKEGNPERPVIDSMNCHTAEISRYVDYHLQPEVTKLKSYTKDSTDAINKIKEIEDQVSENDILVTMDVRSLDTNMHNDEGIQAVRESLNASSTRRPKRTITTFLLLILKLNNFVFNGISFL